MTSGGGGGGVQTIKQELITIESVRTKRRRGNICKRSRSQFPYVEALGVMALI